MASRVNYVLLYRTPEKWRMTVGTPEEMACGALRHTKVTEPFEVAVQEIERLLASQWGLDGPLVWEQIKPDWWGVDVVPGALADSGEAAN